MPRIKLIDAVERRIFDDDTLIANIQKGSPKHLRYLTDLRAEGQVSFSYFVLWLIAPAIFLGSSAKQNNLFDLAPDL